MFRPQERYFAASMSPRGTIWPFRTGRFSEQRRRAIQWRRWRGAWPKRLLWHPWHNPASGNALPENIGGRQAPSVYRTPFVFRANRARCWSYGRPLGNCNGQLLRFFSSEQVDQMLRDGAKRGRAGSHAAIERILKREPEVKRAELWRRIRCLKYPSRATRCRRSVILPLSKELTGMLKKLFRKDGPVFDTTNFRREWIKACVKLGLGKMTGEEWHQYGGLIPHDFRRSAVRNLIQAGVDQSTAMRITGHRTVAVFQRYNIVSTEQLHEAMAKVSENATKTQIAVGNSRNNP